MRSFIKWSIALYVFSVIFFLLQPGDVSLAENKEKSHSIKTEANLLKTDPKDRKVLVYSSSFYIELELADTLTLEQIEDAKTFSVFNNQTMKPVPIRRATWSGANVADTSRPGYLAASLWGDFRPDITYLVRIDYPNGTTEEVECKKPSTLNDAKESTIFNLISDRTSLTFEPMIVESTGVIGIKYDFDFRCFYWTLSRKTSNFLDLSLTSVGEFSTNAEKEKVQNSIRSGFSLDYRKHIKIKLRVPQSKSKTADSREYTYPIGFRLKPVEFESNKDFDVLDYTGKMQLAIAIPYLDFPILWWHGQTGVNRPFLPLLVFTGYTFVREVEKTANDSTNKTNHRWDSEVLYSFPLSNSIDFGFKWFGFLLERKEYKDLIDISLKQYLNESHTRGIHLSYQNGSLPPEFKDTKSFRLGFTIKYF